MKIRRSGSLAALATVAALGSACAAPTVNEAYDETRGAIVDGTKTSTAHPSVGYLITRWGKQQCTATLIAKDVVLSAAHCWNGPSELHFGLGEVAAGQKVYRARPSGDPIYPYAIVHPRFNEPVEAAHDLAYVVLEEPVPSSVAQPARVGRYGDVARCGFALIGYGRSTEGDNLRSDGFLDERRRATFCLSGKESDSGLLKMTGVNGTSCVGDSGGGLMDDARRDDTIVAVVRGGEACRLGATTTFTPLSDNMDFVERALAASR
jgi:hypothetical protein